MQLACLNMGGKVSSAKSREFGRATCHIRETDGLFAGVPEETIVWMSHGDQVQFVHQDFVSLASTETCPRGHPAQIASRVRPSIPSRSQPHSIRQPDSAQLPLRNLRLHRNVGTAIVHRKHSRGSQGTHRRSSRDLRSLRRRRFVRRRGTLDLRHWNSGGLHLRRQRIVAKGRAGIGSQNLSRQFPGRSSCRRCRRPIPQSARRW